MINGSMPLWFGDRRPRPRSLVGGHPVVVATLMFGMQRFDVTWLGKTATFLLMFAVPGFLHGHSSAPGSGGWRSQPGVSAFRA